MKIGESFVVQPKEMKNRGVNIMDGYRIRGRFKADLVCLAKTHSTFWNPVWSG